MLSSIVGWEPTEAQARFLCAGSFEVLFTGDRGAGKTEALLVASLMQVENPNYRALLFRRTQPLVQVLEQRTLSMFPRLCPQLAPRYNQMDREWLFSNGARIRLSPLTDERDRFWFGGVDYHFIGFDGLSDFTAVQYEYLRTRCRATDSCNVTQVRAVAESVDGWIADFWEREKGEIVRAKVALNSHLLWETSYAARLAAGASTS